MMTPSLQIDHALLMQPLEKRSNFRFDPAGLDGGKLRFEFLNNFADRALAIAALHNFSPGAHQA
jgi:hypothetical protein